MSTDPAALGGLDGLDRWNRTIHAICGQFDTELAFNRALFIGDIALASRGGLEVATLRTNAGNIRRAGNAPDTTDDGQCFLVSQRAGFSRISQGGISLELAPGDLVLMDSVGECQITPFGLIEHASLSLPRAQVLQRLGHDTPAFGKISSTKMCGRMLHLLVDQLCKDGEAAQHDGVQGDALQDAMLSLLGPGFEGGDEVVCVTGELSSGHLRSYVQKVIGESLGQSGLTPASLAQRLNISVRHLYRLFEEEGDSVCRYIQRARLQRSADDLANPYLRAESITSIAYKWGFTDSAHFSRSFKKQFEQSPKDFRMSHALVGAA
ncbi:transcriptional regulator FeaR [Pseudomonas putida]